MRLDHGGGKVDTIPQDERENGDNEAVKKEVGEEADADGADYEECAGAPFQTDWFGFGHF